MQDKLVSRDRECDELQRCLESDRSEFVIISGRRRIGKTYLIDKFFNYKYDFTFVGEHNTPASVQIQNFMRAIKRHSKKDSRKPRHGMMPSMRLKIIWRHCLQTGKSHIH